MISLSIILLSLLLGFKHSFDPDHIIAVSNFLPKARSIAHSATMGLMWALGHMATAIIVTYILFFFKDTFLKDVFGKFEILVAFMLVALGIFSIWQSKLLHFHKHGQDEKVHEHYHAHSKGLHRHAHKQIFGVGVIHGLASNDEILVLVTAALGLSTFLDVTVAVILFSLGVVVGMVCFTALISVPIIKSRQKFMQWFNLLAGIVSIGYGIFFFIGLWKVF